MSDFKKKKDRNMFYMHTIFLKDANNAGLALTLGLKLCNWVSYFLFYNH